jgi:hypothetical protein
MNSEIAAVQHLRVMRGGSQAHLLRASDGAYYVTKFQNNPQHIRVLANEMIASRLGRCLKLPMPQIRVMDVSEWLVRNSCEMRIRLSQGSIPCSSGRQAASFYSSGERDEIWFDYLPGNALEKVENLGDFARVMVLDKWACNSDGRQAIFSRSSGRRPYRAAFIDQGYCFNAGEWSFPDSPLRGVYGNRCVYAGVSGWDDFEPALSCAEQADAQQLWSCVEAVPEEWYEGDRTGLERLVEALYRRRLLIRDLIASFRASAQEPFPKWKP